MIALGIMVGLVAAVLVATVAYLVALFQRFGRRGLHAVIPIALGLLAIPLTVEVVSRARAHMYPSYQVLFLQPDRVLGWKCVPNFKWTWTDNYYYARDYGVARRSNSLGFQDREHSVSKPPNTVRVALLGDSMVQAQQVPHEKTAGVLLEEKLNARQASRTYEVLNFGVSNYGTGQSLLVWENYARQFDPDLVFIFVAEFIMHRTVRAEETGNLTLGLTLQVRPTFAVEGDWLVRRPAAVYERFVQAQNEVIDRDFQGGRIRPYKHFLSRPWRQFYANLNGQLQAMSGEPLPTKHTQVRVDPDAWQVNQKVLDELGRQVKKRGTRLVVVDACRFFAPESDLEDKIGAFCDEMGFGYIALSDRLLESEARGEPVDWQHDPHFNETGNRLFAEAMEEWLQSNMPAPKLGLVASLNPRP